MMAYSFLCSIPIQRIRHSLHLNGPRTDHKFTVVFPSVCNSSSGSSYRSGGAVQAPRQMAHSPAGVAHVELPDLGVEDVLELQLRQLTLAQFTVASMECAIPLLKTGKCQHACLFKKMILFGKI